MSADKVILERVFQKKVMKDLGTLPRCYFLKLQERGRRGVLDIHVCLSGQTIWIELKKEDGFVMPLQKLVIEKITQAGGLAFVARPSTWPQQFQMLKDLAARSGPA